MKTLSRITLLIAIVMAGITIANAQRVIKGTVYMDGKPAAGITVEIHKGGSMMTSFDGKYELNANAKSKWIRFTYIDDSKKANIETLKGDVFDYAFTGNLPSAGGDETTVGSKNVNLGTAQELVKAGDEEFKTAYTLYTESYKQGDYQSAMPNWKKLYTYYPKATSNIYVQGGKMYETLIEKASSQEERNKLLDDYMKLYDQRIKYFGKEGYVLGRKGTAWLKFKMNSKQVPEGDALKQVYKTGYEYLSKSVQLQGEEAEPAVLLLLMQSTVALFKLGELPKEQVVKNYEKCTELGNAIVEKSDNTEKVALLKNTILPYVENSFGKSGAADCEVLEKIYSADYEVNKDDVDYIKTMLRRLGKAGCGESELFAKGTERLYELDPSAEAAFNMARRLVGKGDIAKAKEYYQKAMEQETDQDLLASYHLEYGKVLYSQSEYQKARQHAREVLKIQSGNCDAYMLIGKIYVAASRNFPGKQLQKSAVFWVACDYFAKARSGEDCAIDASKALSDYRKYFPNKEDAFMEGLKKGDSYHVGGWINENTRVRF